MCPKTALQMHRCAPRGLEPRKSKCWGTGSPYAAWCSFEEDRFFTRKTTSGFFAVPQSLRGAMPTWASERVRRRSHEGGG